jgi:hypothetical protein
VSAYWLVAADGGIFSFAGAPFYGSTGGMTLNKPVVGMASAPKSQGYWLVASDGGVFTFGSAGFYGSTGGMTLNKPVVGMAATPTGGGYWLVASDGGIFAFGDAQFYGSMGGKPLNQPIVGMAATPDGKGYWFTAADGGVFAFGDAKFYGSLGSVPQIRPVVAVAADADGNGYWFTNDNGAVSAFGTASYWGSAPQVLNKPIVGIAEADATGQISGSTYPAGSYGYDISNYQCGGYPAAAHTIGIVQVNGASFGATNPCLASEAAWAAGGLNLYTFLTYGTMATSGDPACQATAAPGSCNFGFNAALDAFGEAQAAGIDTSVAWWLDVEGKTLFWSSDPAANAALVQGAIDGLHYAGINSVGIYASPGEWNTIVGTYQPAVPYWLAWWTGTGPYNCANVGQWTARDRLPTGPVVVTQFTSNTGVLDEDYAC